jgi:hypothetical protein
MAKKFSDLRAKMKPEAQKRAAVIAQTMLAEMPLNELRQARGLSQKMLAEMLQVQQPSIAKLEKRTDMYLSTLRSHIEAMGGELDIVARFPDGTVKISNFSDLGKAASILMSTIKHNDWLFEQLKDAEFAAEYLNAASEDDDPKTYLTALRKVVEARGGMA